MNKTLTTTVTALAMVLGLAGAVSANHHEKGHGTTGAHGAMDGHGHGHGHGHAMHAKHTLVEAIMASPEHKTLAKALKAAGLIETLKGKGPFTVHAPTDKAFAALPAGALDNLLKPENKAKLVAVLTYHVVPAKVMAADVLGMTKNGAIARPKTVEGHTLTVKSSGKNVMVDDAHVLKVDMVCKNGVIHVIDKVLMPKM